MVPKLTTSFKHSVWAMASKVLTKVLRYIERSNSRSTSRYLQQHPRLRNVLLDSTKPPELLSAFGLHVKGICSTVLGFDYSKVYVQGFDEDVFYSSNTTMKVAELLNLWSKSVDTPACLRGLVTDFTQLELVEELGEDIDPSFSLMHLIVEVAKKLKYYVSFAVPAEDVVWCIIRRSSTLAFCLEIHRHALDNTNALVQLPNELLIAIANIHALRGEGSMVVPAIAHPLCVLKESFADMSKSLPSTYQALTQLYNATGTYTLDQSGQRMLTSWGDCANTSADYDMIHTAHSLFYARCVHLVLGPATQQPNYSTESWSVCTRNDYRKTVYAWSGLSESISNALLTEDLTDPLLDTYAASRTASMKVVTLSSMAIPYYREVHTIGTDFTIPFSTVVLLKTNATSIDDLFLLLQGCRKFPSCIDYLFERMYESKQATIISSLEHHHPLLNNTRYKWTCLLPANGRGSLQSEHARDVLFLNILQHSAKEGKQRYKTQYSSGVQDGFDESRDPFVYGDTNTV